MRTKQDACINLTSNKQNNDDLDSQKRKIIANTSNQVKYARKMDRERIETSLGLIIKNSLSSTTPTLKQLTQSQIAAAAAANNTSMFVKNYVTSKRIDQKQNKKEDDLNSAKSDDENTKNKNETETANNENCSTKEIKIKNSTDETKNTVQMRRCNSYNPSLKSYKSEIITEPAMNHHSASNFDSRFKRYSFSYLSKSDMEDSLASISQQHFRSSSLNRNLLNAEHIKIFLNCNNHNNKQIDANLLNEYLIYNKYLSENNLLSKSVPFLWNNPNENDGRNLTSHVINNKNNINYRINENSYNNAKKSKDLLGNNILFEHLVNSGKGTKNENYNGNNDVYDPDGDILRSIIFFLKLYYLKNTKK